LRRVVAARELICPAAPPGRRGILSETPDQLAREFEQRPRFARAGLAQNQQRPSGPGKNVADRPLLPQICQP